MLRSKGGVDPLASEFPRVTLPREYTLQQLNDFGKRLEDFYEERTITMHTASGEPEKVRILNFPEACVAFGAMTKKNGDYFVVIEEEGNDSQGRPRYKYPTRYQVFMDKYEQWMKVKAKREYASEKSVERYESMAEEVLGSMRYTHDLPEHEA